MLLFKPIKSTRNRCALLQKGAFYCPNANLQLFKFKRQSFARYPPLSKSRSFQKSDHAITRGCSEAHSRARRAIHASNTPLLSRQMYDKLRHKTISLAKLQPPRRGCLRVHSNTYALAQLRITRVFRSHKMQF